MISCFIPRCLKSKACRWYNQVTHVHWCGCIQMQVATLQWLAMRTYTWTFHIYHSFLLLLSDFPHKFISAMWMEVNCNQNGSTWKWDLTGNLVCNSWECYHHHTCWWHSSDNSSGTEELPCKRTKIDGEERARERKLAQDNLETLTSRLHFKHQLLEKARSLNNFKQCDEISGDIVTVRKEKVTIENQLAALLKREAKSTWYHLKK